MPKLSDLKQSILEDGKIDNAEVKVLREEIYADGKIDRDEAEFLFELNDECSEAENDPSWEEFFVEAISDCLLNDEDSPNEIDDQECDWLMTKIQKDGKLDAAEKALLIKLKNKAKSMPDRLANFINENIN